MAELSIDDLMDLRNEALNALSRVQLAHSRFTFFLGVIIGIMGNLLGSYWIEYQKLLGILTINSILIFLIVTIIFIIIGYFMYVRIERKINALLKLVNSNLLEIEHMISLLPSPKENEQEKE